MSATKTWLIDTMNLDSDIKHVINEYFETPKSYKKPRLCILPNIKDKYYDVCIKNDINGTEDNGIFELITFIRLGENGLEIDEDRIHKIAHEITSKNFSLLHR